MKISLEQLQILDAIEQRGSYAAAAHALHRVPSALTHAVKKLEDDLGVALFEKQGRRAVLTAIGRSLLDEGRLLLRSAAALEDRVQRLASGWESELRLAVSMLIPAERLFPLLDRFYAEGHGTRLRLDYEVLAGCWDALTTGRADLSIGAHGDLPPGGGITSRYLGEAELVFAVAPHHPLAGEPEPIGAQTLLRHRVVIIPDTARELAARSAGVSENQDYLRVPDMATKLAAQIAGLGIGYLPRWQAVPEVAAGRLVIKQLADTRPRSSLYYAWRARQEGNALGWFQRELGKAEVQQTLLLDL